MIPNPLARPVAKKVEFVRASVEVPKTIVLSVDGMPKTGKTQFALSGPASICVHDFDFGLSAPVQNFRDKEIYAFDYQVPFSAALPGSETSSIVDEARRVWNTFGTQFRASLQEMRTVVVDQMSEAWNICRLARLGKLTKVLPHQYVEVNAEFRQLIQTARSSPANVIFIHRLKAEYKNDQPTGKFERSGFGDIGYDVDAVVRTELDSNQTGEDKFSGTIETSRANLIQAVGQKLTGKNFTFAGIAKILYPDSTEEQWK